MSWRLAIILSVCAVSYLNCRADDLRIVLSAERQRQGSLTCVGFTVDGGFSANYANGFFNQNIPEEAHRYMHMLAAQGSRVKCVAINSVGGWSVIFDKNGFFNRNIPDPAHQAMLQLAANDHEIKWITFTPSHGWTVFYDEKGYINQGLPDAAHAAVVNAAGKHDLTSMSFAGDDSFCLIYNGGRSFEIGNLEDCVRDPLTRISNMAPIKQVAFSGTGRMCILYGKNGFELDGISGDDKPSDSTQAGTAARHSASPSRSTGSKASSPNSSNVTVVRRVASRTPPSFVTSSQVQAGVLSAETVRFNLAGQIESADGTFALDGSITNGTPFQGYYVFDSTRQDSNPDPNVGDYRYTNSAFGIVIKAGNYVFRSDPANVSFNIQTINRNDGDRYLVTSDRNVSSGKVAISRIAWQLDGSPYSVSNDRLPLLPQVLTNFATSSLTIEGPGGLTISAAVDTVSETATTPVGQPFMSIQQAVAVKWESELGRVYQIQYSEDLKNWNVTGELILGEGTTMVRFVEVPIGTKSIYRVSAVPDAPPSAQR